MKVGLPIRHAAVGVLFSTALACAGAPQPVAVPPGPASFEPRLELEIWQGHEARTLHSVRIAGDSLTGVPTWKPPACDSCRVAVPVSAIDSLRAVHNERAWMMTAALPFVALGAAVVAWRLSGGD